MNSINDASLENCLISLYHATNGKNWTSNKNWLSNKPLEQWEGVSIKDGKLSIDLYDKGLSGEIPESFFNLYKHINIENIDLSRNQIHGLLPDSISLCNSGSINVSNNFLFGPVPKIKPAVSLNAYHNYLDKNFLVNHPSINLENQLDAKLLTHILIDNPFLSNVHSISNLTWEVNPNKDISCGLFTISKENNPNVKGNSLYSLHRNYNNANASELIGHFLSIYQAKSFAQESISNRFFISPKHENQIIPVLNALNLNDITSIKNSSNEPTFDPSTPTFTSLIYKSIIDIINSENKNAAITPLPLNETDVAIYKAAYSYKGYTIKQSKDSNLYQLFSKVGAPQKMFFLELDQAVKSVEQLSFDQQINHYTHSQWERTFLTNNVKKEDLNSLNFYTWFDKSKPITLQNIKQWYELNHLSLTPIVTNLDKSPDNTPVELIEPFQVSFNLPASVKSKDYLSLFINNSTYETLSDSEKQNIDRYFKEQSSLSTVLNENYSNPELFSFTAGTHVNSLGIRSLVVTNIESSFKHASNHDKYLLLSDKSKWQFDEIFTSGDRSVFNVTTPDNKGFIYEAQTNFNQNDYITNYIRNAAFKSVPLQDNLRWLDVSLDYISRYAAEKGYHTISLPTGESLMANAMIHQEENALVFSQGNSTTKYDANLLTSKYDFDSNYSKSVDSKNPSLIYLTEKQNEITQANKLFYDETVPSHFLKLNSDILTKITFSHFDNDPNLPLSPCITIDDTFSSKHHHKSIPLFDVSTSELLNNYGSIENFNESIKNLALRFNEINHTLVSEHPDVDTNKYDQISKSLHKRYTHRNFIESGYVPILGLEVKSPQHLADIFEIHRSPNIEKTHAVFIKDNKIVNTTAVSCGSSVFSQVSALSPEILMNTANELRADRVVLLHNHPSGNPTPSLNDRELFSSYNEEFKNSGISFEASIINTFTFTHTSFESGQADTKTYPYSNPELIRNFTKDYFSLDTSNKEHFIKELSNINNSLINLDNGNDKDQQYNNGVITLLDSSQKIKGYVPIPLDLNSKELSEFLEKSNKEFNASFSALTFKSFNHSLDAVTIPSNCIFIQADNLTKNDLDSLISYSHAFDFETNASILWNADKKYFPDLSKEFSNVRFDQTVSGISPTNYSVNEPSTSYGGLTSSSSLEDKELYKAYQFSKTEFLKNPGVTNFRNCCSSLHFLNASNYFNSEHHKKSCILSEYLSITDIASRNNIPVIFERDHITTLNPVTPIFSKIDSNTFLNSSAINTAVFDNTIQEIKPSSYLSFNEYAKLISLPDFLISQGWNIDESKYPKSIDFSKNGATLNVFKILHDSKEQGQAPTESYAYTHSDSGEVKTLANYIQENYSSKNNNNPLTFSDVSNILNSLHSRNALPLISDSLFKLTPSNNPASVTFKYIKENISLPEFLLNHGFSYSKETNLFSKNDLSLKIIADSKGTHSALDAKTGSNLDVFNITNMLMLSAKNPRYYPYIKSQNNNSNSLHYLSHYISSDKNITPDKSTYNINPAVNVSLDLYKSTICLPEFMIKYGYSLVKRDSPNVIRLERDNPYFPNSKENIIVSKLNGKYHYWEQHQIGNLNTSKSIIDFVMDNEKLNVSQSISFLDKFIKSPSFAVDYISKLSLSDDKIYKNDLTKIEKLYNTVNNIHPINEESKFLLANRSIDPLMATNPMFLNQIKTNTYWSSLHNNNISRLAIPMHNHSSSDKLPAGISLRLNGEPIFKGEQRNCVAHSNFFPNRPLENVFITESFLDSLAHAQLIKNFPASKENNLYISTEGSLSEQQIKLIARLVSSKKPTNLILATDNDASGHRYAAKFAANFMPLSDSIFKNAQIKIGANSVSFGFPKSDDNNFSPLEANYLISNNKVFSNPMNSQLNKFVVSMDNDINGFNVSFSNTSNAWKIMSELLLENARSDKFNLVRSLPITNDFNDDLKVSLGTHPMVKLVSPLSYNHESKSLEFKTDLIPSHEKVVQILMDNKPILQGALFSSESQAEKSFNKIFSNVDLGLSKVEYQKVDNNLNITVNNESNVNAKKSSEYANEQIQQEQKTKQPKYFQENQMQM